MELEFIKLHSCGSDHILIDGLKHDALAEEELPGLAAQITSRHFGVGAESLLVVQRGGRETLQLLAFDPAGNPAAPNPLAVRCASRYAFDAGLVHGDLFAVEANQERQSVEIVDSRNIMVVSGPPWRTDRSEQLLERPGEKYLQRLTLGKWEFNCTPLHLRMDHLVVFPPSDDWDTAEMGREMELQGVLGPGACLETVKVFSREAALLRVWESGRGEPLASEYAACAAAVAAAVNGLTDREVQVHLQGGNLLVQWSERDNLLRCSGPADYVFMGTYYYEEGEVDED